MNKIHIFGIYGSGKSTLAKSLSLKTGIALYKLDDLKYIRNFDITTPKVERIKKLEEICKKDCWITEGTWSNFAEIAFQNADVLIYINFPIYVPIFGVIKRYLKRKINGEMYRRDSFIDLLFIISEVKNYYLDKRIVSKYVHNCLTKRYKNKVIVIKNKIEYKQIMQINRIEDLLKFNEIKDSK